MPPISTNWLIVFAILAAVIVAVISNPKSKPDQDR